MSESTEMYGLLYNALDSMSEGVDIITKGMTSCFRSEQYALAMRAREVVKKLNYLADTIELTEVPSFQSPGGEHG